MQLTTTSIIACQKININHYFKHICLLISLFFLTALYAQTPNKTKKTIRVNKSTFPLEHQLLNIGNMSAWIKKNGISSQAPSDNAGAKYPKNTAAIVYRDGLMWVGLVNDIRNPSLPKLRATGQNYRTGTQPGHILISGNATTEPVYSDSSLAKVYRIRRDWQALTIGSPELIEDAAIVFEVEQTEVTQQMQQSVLDDYQFSWNNWPTDLGAPFYDHNKNGIYDIGIDEPGLQNADQVIWLVINDANSMGLFESPPTGVEIQITLWSFKNNSPIGQAQYKRYRLINKSGLEIRNMYLSWWADMDIGMFTNDLIGCNEALDLGYNYNGYTTDDEFDKFNLPPSAAGYTLLQGPITSSPGDTAIFNFEKRVGFKNLGMTSFSYKTTHQFQEPFVGYESTLMWYNWIRGYTQNTDTLNPTPVTNTITGQPTKFPFNGNPITGIGEVDGNYFSPGDRHSVLNTGNFVMQPGDTQEVVLALVGGNEGVGTNITSVASLFANVESIRNLYGTPVTAYPTATFSQNSVTPTEITGIVNANLGYLGNVNTAKAILRSSDDNGLSFEIDLFDDGLHNDGAANDGIWGNSITVGNQKYSYRVDIDVITVDNSYSFPNAITGIILRPAPRLENYRILWENGLQDKQINSGEKVHIGFDIVNNDAVNSINNFSIKYNFEEQNQLAVYNGTISNGGIATDSSLFIVSEAQIGADSIEINIAMNFDVHSIFSIVKLPISSWNPPTNWTDTLKVFSTRGVTTNAFAIIADPNLLNNDNYRITFTQDTINRKPLVWNLFNDTKNTQILAEQPLYKEGLYNHPIVDGVMFVVSEAKPNFSNFTAISNANGLLNPPQAGALTSVGFPSNGIGPNDLQQVGAGKWAIHTFDDGSRSSFDSFVSRTIRNGWEEIFPYDFELRFTAEGGYAQLRFASTGYIEVPFELWNIGKGTPNDPSDDYRMFPVVLDDDLNNEFNLPAPGSRAFGTDDHTASPMNDDPYTDMIYWFNPTSTTGSEQPGDAAYLNIVNKIQNGTFDGFLGLELMSRMVLINWNGGNTLPYNQDLPEIGTTFRIETTKPNFAGDELVIIAPANVVELEIPVAYELSQNYPNPFNPSTEIQFSIPNVENVKLEIFNVLGQKIRTLVNSRKQSGKYTVTWNGVNESGIKVASGIYFYRISAGEFVKSRKMTLIK